MHAAPCILLTTAIFLPAVQVAQDVAAGLAYLHPSVVHRDLKPQVGRATWVVLRTAAWQLAASHCALVAYDGWPLLL